MTTLTNRATPRAKRRRLGAVLLAAIFVLILPAVVLAHPLGNFTVNRYSRLELGAAQVMLTYVVDMAEIPTQQVRPEIDTDGNGNFSPAEQQAYLAKLIPSLQEQLQLEVDGQSQPWTLGEHVLTFPEGQAGLPTIRLRVQFSSQIGAGESISSASFTDQTFADRLGWQEVVVRAIDGVDLLTSNVPAVDLSQELTEYPSDLLQSPPAVNQAQFQYQIASVGAGSSQPSMDVPNSQIMESLSADTDSPNAPLAASSDPFAELIHLPNLGPWTLFLALLAAFGWGAAHALSPGHGKTIVGAYLVGSRGTAKHALFLGLTTTVTHTAGVFALGLITLFASRYILPETLFPWLSLFSGLLVVVIGLSMAWSWLQRFRAQKVGQHHHHHGHSHDEHHHHHGYSHDAHDHHHGHSHDEHHHPEEEGSGVHSHTHSHAMEHAADHAHSGLHTHDGVHYHSHEVPGQDGEPITWRSLLALGISGGLLPCPSALVVMLGAIALQRVAFGLLLIIAFSMGLAGVLTAFGLALVYAGKFFARLPESGRVLKLLPVASALFITVLGAGITWQAVMGM